MSRLHHGHSFTAGALTVLGLTTYRLWLIVAAAFAAGAASAMLATYVRGNVRRLGALLGRLAGTPKGLPW